MRSSRSLMRAARAPLACLSLALLLGACGREDEEPEGPLIDPNGQEFTYDPPGALIEGSGEGVADDTVFAPGMRFPVERAPAYANSQVYKAGGIEGPGGGQCAEENYSYPWQDNYCEERPWTVPLCPRGNGHQGQDIRPATCEKSVHWAVATEDGQITGIGSYSVILTGASGTVYRYLHLDMAQLAVTQGQTIVRGQRIGLVSNDFGGAPTTIHLHFDIRQAVELEDGGVVMSYVPPYTSLIESYKALLRGEEN